jgi:hypothetical protein
VAERLEPWASASTELVDLPIERQAWTPPPPPHEPSQLRETPELPEVANSSGALSVSGHYSDSISVPPLPDDWSPEPLSQRRVSHALPIAIALALAVPISLLIGAIIGFMVRGRL